MNLLKLMTVLTLILSFQSFAETPPAPSKEDNFEKHKKQTLENLDFMIKDSQDLRSCIANTKSHDEMKKCHEDQKKRREEMESKHKDHRKEMIDEQIKRLQDEKSKLDQQTKK